MLVLGLAGYAYNLYQQARDAESTEFADLIQDRELMALNSRIKAMLNEAALPALDPHQDVPWPFV